MTAKQIFQTRGISLPAGKLLKCSKGGYRGDTFAYCISDDGSQYNVKAISKVLPRAFSVMHGLDASVHSLENAILYNERRARVEHKQNGLTERGGAA